MSEELQKKNPLREIVQPFIDLVHAPRALWGVNLAYVLEGMVYFGMLGYLAIYFSDFIFQGVEHSDEYSHNSVMVLTAGITIAMFFLGSVADKRGVRFALIAAFVFLLIGRIVISGAPNLMGLKPTRPGVFVGDQVRLHVTQIDTRDGIKAITQATVIANDEGGADVEGTQALDLAAGEGIVPSKKLESRLVRLSEATVLSGKDNSWIVQYGSARVTARLQARSAKDQCVCAGAVISVKSAYVTARKNDAKGKEGGGYEFFLRCHWSEDFERVDTSRCISDGDAEILHDLDRLRLRNVAKPAERVAELLRSNNRGELEARVLEIVQSAHPDQWTGRVLGLLQSNPLEKNGEDKEKVCKRKVGDHEKIQKPKERWPVATDTKVMGTATTVDIVELRELPDGPVNVVLRDARVTYVRNGGYFLQSRKDGPAMFAFVDPIWSTLHLVTLFGIVLVVFGYGMYQPAAYAAVRQFTTPKTAAMGFAMLYALMNLGGWLPTFAFLLRDDKFLGLGIPGTYWIYTGFTLLALVATVVILSRRTLATATRQAKEESAADGKQKPEEKAAKEENTAEMGSGRAPLPPVHMWLLALAFLGTVYWKVGAPWNTQVCTVLAALWTALCFIPTTGRYLAMHPLADVKFFFFIFALIPVQTLFTYNWLILPQYISRSFEGWIGEYFEIASNANPLLIFIAVPVIAAVTRKAKVYNMMIYGTFVMAAPAFLLALGPHPWTLFGYLLIMTIGEAMWQPRFLQYAAEIAPKGRTGQYMGVAQLPWFMTKMLVPWLYSGWVMDRYCPAEGVRNTELMWFYFGCIAITSTVLLIVAKGWVGKDFKTKAS